MRNKIAAILLAVTMSGFLSGCALFRGSSTTTQKAADVEKLAYIAASTGTQLAILDNPTLRPGFETALASLNTVVENKTINGLVLRQILATLPVKELNSPEARIAIANATMLFDLTVGDTLNIEMNPYVAAAGKGIRDGMRDALAVTSPTFAPKPQAFKPVWQVLPSGFLTNVQYGSTSTVWVQANDDGRLSIVHP